MLKIRSHLALMAATILVPVVIFSATSLQMLRSGERHAALRGLQETARATALTVDREMSASLASLELLAASPALESDDLPTFYLQAELLNDGKNSWTVLLNDRGQQILNTALPYGKMPPQPDLATTAASVQEVMRNRKPKASDLLMSPLTGKPSTTLYVPVKALGGERYVLAQTFAVDFLSAKAFERDSPPGWVIAVFDTQGIFIARNKRSGELVGKRARPELVDAARARPEGYIRHKTWDDVDSYDAFTHSAVTGWVVAVAAPVDSLEAAAGDAVKLAGIGLFVAILAAIGMAVLLGRQIVQAIDGAAAAAAALGQGKSLPPASGPVLELRQLHSALADAGKVLHAAQASRQKAEAELELLLKKEHAGRLHAEAENTAKDQFLAMLGHELRNPLAAISGAVALNEHHDRRDDGVEGTGEVREIIRRQSKHLSRIVDDLLDVSRLASGKISLHTSPVNLSQIARSCVDSLRASGRMAGYEVTVQAADVWVNGDATRLEQVVSNLLVNAVKFTPAGGTIALTVGPVGDTAELSLRDSGVGISAELLPRVFEAFTQGPASLDRAQGGLGIGLALVRQLVNLHGGQVRVESAGANQGSTFTFALPRIEAPGELPTLQVHPLPAGRPCHVLLIEDNADIRRTMSELLQMEGHTVSEAATALQGLALASELQPDLAIIDIGLPEMTGYDVARHLRADPKTQGIHLMAMTGYGQEEDRSIALAAGFDVHLVKPIDITHVLGLINLYGQDKGPASPHAS